MVSFIINTFDHPLSVDLTPFFRSLVINTYPPFCAPDHNPNEVVTAVLNDSEDPPSPGNQDPEFLLECPSKLPSSIHHFVVKYRYWLLFGAPGVLLVHLLSTWLSRQSGQPLMGSNIYVTMGECGDRAGGNASKIAACFRFNQTNQV